MNALHVGIYNKLAAGTALTDLLSGGTASLYHLAVPDGASLPYVVWNVQGGGDENLTANRTKNLVVFVRGYSGASAGAAGTIDAEIDTLLHDQELILAASNSQESRAVKRKDEIERIAVSAR